MPHGGATVVALPETRYAKSGEIRIAYQILGNGFLDLVFVPGFISNLDAHWEDPGFNHLMTRLSSFTRLIMLDKHGTGFVLNRGRMSISPAEI